MRNYVCQNFPFGMCHFAGSTCFTAKETFTKKSTVQEVGKGASTSCMKPCMCTGGE